MPSNVRVSVHQNGDTHAAGWARLKLKLAAIAYASTRHGIDATESLAHTGLMMLGAASCTYYEAITNTPIGKRPELRYNGRAMERLQLAAVAYVNARHGVDAEQGLAKMGLALLCSIACEVYETATGADPARRPEDPGLQIGNGV